LNRYEALYVFPESLKDNTLDEVLGEIKNEIKKLGGDVESTTRLGKRAFSRRMKKQDAGHYVMVAFKLGGDQVHALQSRFKLNENVFRVQVVRASEKVAAPAGAKGEGKAHGDA
jgi:ribosomal protein S6